MDNIIKIKKGIPRLGSDEFKSWLKKWHDDNNGENYRPKLQVTDKGRELLSTLDDECPLLIDITQGED